MAVGYINVVKVQDILTNTWYTYSANSGWDKQPIILTPWGGLYVSAWITNFSGSTHTLTVSIESEGKKIVDKTQTVVNGEGFGIETPGTIAFPPAVTSFYVKVVTEVGGVYILNWQVIPGDPVAPTYCCPECDVCFFTQAQLDEHMLTHVEPPPDEPPPDIPPTPPGTSMPAVLLAGFPVAVHCLWLLRESFVPAYVHALLHPLI